MNNSKNKLSKKVKLIIQVGLIFGLVTISIWGYLPIIDFFDELLYLNFSHLIFGLVTISIWGYLPIIDFFDELLYL
ncbi:hypothetical protein AB0Y06_08805, partial [Ligilactobacillus salivarius]|uniref:hypothetical protein n=1 Tax=Ligilactobacillus salivarius TaxID=1624 RepID=UPI003F23C7B8